MSERIERFVESIDERISYFRKEYELTYAEAIGCLELIKFDLMMEAKGDGESPDAGSPEF